MVLRKVKYMRDIKLFLQLTLYYSVVALSVMLLSWASPDFVDFLNNNKGIPEFTDSLGLNHLISGEGKSEAFVPQAHYMRDLFFGTLGAIVMIFPCSWVYLKVRTKVGLNQALIKTMIILPIIVASVVTIVQNSLALAFSLAGIVAAVRFRHTIRSSADTLFIFVSIGVGLAAGVNALGVALIMTLFFNYVFLILFSANFGYRNHPGAEKYMRPSRAKKHRASLVKKKSIIIIDQQE